MDYLSIAKRQLSIDYDVCTDIFNQDNFTIITPKDYGKNAMNYYTVKPYLNFIYFGKGLLVVANDEIRDFTVKYLNLCGNDLYRAFDAPNISILNSELMKKNYVIAHLAEYFVPSDNAKININEELEYQIYEEEEIDKLYNLGFNMALCGTTHGNRRDQLAVASFIDGKIVGVAAATNDSFLMWQIGVDVLKEYRGRKIASTLVYRLKDLIKKKGKCPFYCCSWSNIASKKVAKNAGFINAWVELTAKNIKTDWIDDIKKKIYNI